MGVCMNDDIETIRRWAAYIGFPPKARAALDRLAAELARNRGELARIIGENEKLRFRAENCEQSTQMDVVKRLEAEVERLRVEWKQALHDRDEYRHEVERLRNRDEGWKAKVVQYDAEIERLRAVEKAAQVVVEWWGDTQGADDAEMQALAQALEGSSDE